MNVYTPSLPRWRDYEDRQVAVVLSVLLHLGFARREALERHGVGRYVTTCFHGLDDLGLDAQLKLRGLLLRSRTKSGGGRHGKECGRGVVVAVVVFTFGS